LVSVRVIPWFTVLLVATSIMFLYSLATEPLWIWLTSDPMGKFMCWLFHPLIHGDGNHLWGNILFGLIPVGILIESWMRRLKYVARIGILAFSYLVSLTVSGVDWIQMGSPAYGSSGIIFAALPVILFYYSNFYDPISRQSGLVAPILIGVVLAFLGQSLYLGVMSPYPYLNTAKLHLETFGVSLVVFF
jgi:hypothetical protein